MTPRRFATRCAECRQKTMAIVTVPYDVQVDHDGKTYDVHIPQFAVPKCANCGALSIDDVASEQIGEAFHQAAGLLTGKTIREWRNKLRLEQQEFAEWLGVSPATVSRWETGAQIQQRAMDRYMRVFFGSEQVRRMLGNNQELAKLGLAREPDWAANTSVGRILVVGEIIEGHAVMAYVAMGASPGLSTAPSLSDFGSVSLNQPRLFYRR